ncbi:uncharacterized protein [Rutidosis leptorrhynchoides]|uniref:uncharacterized protein n=1 Tax=Rutidosis leptorrhynchoides TaxID=125765 RepID=UPI003A99E8EB
MSFFQRFKASSSLGIKYRFHLQLTVQGNMDIKYYVTNRCRYFCLMGLMNEEKTSQGPRHRRCSVCCYVLLWVTHQYSRVPVFEQRVDNIVGIAYAMDLLDYVQKLRN